MSHPITISTISSHEASAAFNATSLALAKSQRLLSSWFPRSATDGIPATTKLEQEEKEEEKEEDHELFASLPDLPGLGAGKGDADAGERGREREREGNEKLRRELLGRGRGQGNVNIKAMGSKPCTVPVPAKRKERHDSSSDDEEGGRTSLGRAKNGARKQIRVQGEEYHAAAATTTTTVGVNSVVLETEKRAAAYGVKERSPQGSKIKTKRNGSGVNYLDEVLANRSQKKKKKRKKKMEDGGSRNS